MRKIFLIIFLLFFIINKIESGICAEKVGWNILKLDNNTNAPYLRHFGYGFDTTGNIWIYGGMNENYTRQSRLYKYDASTNLFSEQFPTGDAPGSEFLF